MVHVNGKKVGGNANICKFTAYVSPYFVVSNGGAYTKHIYAANQRIASKLGNVDGFGADPRRVEMAGGKKYDDKQSETIKARFEALHIDYSDGNGKKDDEEYKPTMDSEEPENLVFFYHPDHLGSTSYVTDADGNIAQHVEYIPYGEVFVEERNSQFSTNYLFNAKELDNETGLYYYGARYLDPTGAMWLSVDPLFEKYAGMSSYNYCAGNPVKLVDPDGEEPYNPFTKLPYDKEAKRSARGYNLSDGFKCQSDGGCTPASIILVCEKRGVEFKFNDADKRRDNMRDEVVLDPRVGADIKKEFYDLTSATGRIKCGLDKVIENNGRKYVKAGLQEVWVYGNSNLNKQFDMSQLPNLLSNKDIDLMGTFYDQYDKEWGNHTMLIESVELKYDRDGDVNFGRSDVICVNPRNMDDKRRVALSSLRKLVLFDFSTSTDN